MYPPEMFFDLNDFKWKGIFENIENTWEVLARLKNTSLRF